MNRAISDKRTRLDRRGTQLITRDVPPDSQNQPTLDDPAAIGLARLGQKAAEVLGGALDIERAIAGGRVWLLQARPVTAAPPPPAAGAATPPGSLAGTPGSQGTVTGTARIVLGPGDFARVHPGDILVCPYTDPGWTLLLRIAAGVVTETGGVLSTVPPASSQRLTQRIEAQTMGTRRLYLARHGAADPFGELTGIGRQQANLLGKRLAGLPIDTIWHSPLPRAAASAHEIARHLPDVAVAEAAELIDHVPYVPGPAEIPPSWAGFFDGYDATEAASGHRLAESLTARFAKIPGPSN